MKNVSMLLWVTQLGLSVVVSPVALILLAVWLRDSQGWGSWVIWVAVAIGLYCAIVGLFSSLKQMQQQADREDREEKPVSFNEHV